MASAKYTFEGIAEAFKKADFVKMETAKILKMSVQNLYQLIRMHPELKEMMDEARDECVDYAKSGLTKHVKKGNLKAIQYALEREDRRLGGFVKKVEVDVTVKEADEGAAIIKALGQKYADCL